MYAFFLRHKMTVSLKASMEARLEVSESKSLLLQVGSEIAVLDMRVKFSYQIPSFSVLIVDLRLRDLLQGGLLRKTILKKISYVLCKTLAVTQTTS